MATVVKMIAECPLTSICVWMLVRPKIVAFLEENGAYTDGSDDWLAICKF